MVDGGSCHAVAVVVDVAGVEGDAQADGGAGRAGGVVPAEGRVELGEHLCCQVDLWDVRGNEDEDAVAAVFGLAGGPVGAEGRSEDLYRASRMAS